MISCVQKTKFADTRRVSTFKFHLSASFTHKVFVNNPNVLHTQPTRGHSAGVVKLLHSNFPGFDTAAEISRLSVPGRYLVVKVTVEHASIYIHNVYAPFEDDAKHFMLGDLNTPLDPRLDSSTPDLNSDSSRSDCLEWIAKLGVVDAWRINSYNKRVFTGPLPWKNRLDYILMSERFCDCFYDKSKYFLPKHTGDHLAHSVSFRSGTMLYGRGYWKFRRYLLDYPLVVSKIEKEADLVRENIRIAQNPDKVWEKWKLDVKAQLQDPQKKIRQQDTQAVEDARVLLHQAAVRGLRWDNADSPSGTAPTPDNIKLRMLLESVSRFVSDTDRDILDADLTEANLSNAIRHMRKT
ncbi:hypothetical protein PsorP6_011912 [Peronosclerospora sorghi]|uniref:Uncharacterized protein n=1 Tax=Peronosclerospora sorghi TaxID=230839 RepID=A0ACC0WJC2_9STRA|nr:hypothetical protein PsorP6_011912 [Peronosclerospora sorghi]